MSCGLCSEPAKYACPRCNIQYCSLKCYRCPEHASCSEEFYKEAIHEELKSSSGSDPSRIRGILEKIHRGEEEEEDSTDSDDDEDLDARLRDINLDDSEEVWSRLTPQEKRDFNKALESGEMEAYIPEYVPWWIKKPIAPLEDSSRIPLVTPDVQALPPHKKVSPSLPYTILNVLYSYAYAMRFVYGDYTDDPQLFNSMVLHLSLGLKNDGIFEGVDLALESAASRVDPLYSVSRDLTRSVKKDAILLARDYVLEALSDLRNSLKRQKKEDPILKKEIKLAVIKLEFLIAYAKTHWKGDILSLKIK
ncbi:Uncharacterized protein FKW44_016889 [Caligus rogercresseyi]|uniref:HIT-type domain-containing protein n=1 Tax=Caligus rogercresseyi TaxID=217165 RepID=A0A7T8K0S9_CALRO|nr:Uncharacterized protein FKW44_016889 [Caligus rogercresseyi]